MEECFVLCYLTEYKSQQHYVQTSTHLVTLFFHRLFIRLYFFFLCLIFFLAMSSMALRGIPWIIFIFHSASFFFTFLSSCCVVSCVNRCNQFNGCRLFALQNANRILFRFNYNFFPFRPFLEKSKNNKNKCVSDGARKRGKKRDAKVNLTNFSHASFERKQMK